MSEYRSKEVLRAYRIPTTAEHLVTSAREAAAAAASLGYPVVMKACADGLAHKSELGLVEVGVTTPRGVRAAYRRLVDDSPVDLDGVLVSEMVTGGVEVVVGASHDPVFGPTVMVGLGGVFVEVLGDVTFRVPPFGRDEAKRMLRELRAAALFGGVRGAPPADTSALVDVIMRVQRLMMDLGDEIAEVDLNPVLVRPRGHGGGLGGGQGGGQGAVALDALVVRR